MIDDRVRLDGLKVDGRGIAELVARLARVGGLDRRQEYRMRLAADEIATNIAEHGYSGCGGVIDIAGGVDEEWVWLRIEDHAPAFNPCGHDAGPRLAADPDTAPPGGFGVFLAVSGVDRFDHEYLDGRNRTTLRQRRPDRPGTTDGGTDAQDERVGGG